MTAKAQPTPGPWKQEGYYVWSPVAKANVATVSDPYEGRDVGFHPVELGSPYSKEAWANARLIAAAPALLEAAKNALQVIEDVYGISLEGEDDTDEPQHSTQLMLWAAIAQAEGRQP